MAEDKESRYKEWRTTEYNFILSFWKIKTWKPDHIITQTLSNRSIIIKGYLLIYRWYFVNITLLVIVIMIINSLCRFSKASPIIFSLPELIHSKNSYTLISAHILPANMTIKNWKVRKEVFIIFTSSFNDQRNRWHCRRH